MKHLQNQILNNRSHNILLSNFFLYYERQEFEERGEKLEAEIRAEYEEKGEQARKDIEDRFRYLI